MFARLLLLSALVSLSTTGCLCVPPPACCMPGPRLLPPMLIPPPLIPRFGCVVPMRGPAVIRPVGIANRTNLIRQRQVIKHAQYAGAPPQIQQKELHPRRTVFSRPKFPKQKKYTAVVRDSVQTSEQPCQCDDCKKHRATGCQDCATESGPSCASPAGVCVSCNTVTAFGTPIHGGRSSSSSARCDCVDGTTNAYSPPEIKLQERKSVQSKEERVPPPAPIPPPPEDDPPAQDMTEDDAPKAFGKKEDWNPRPPQTDPIPTPAEAAQPPAAAPEQQRRRPEFESPPSETTPNDSDADTAIIDSDLQPVNYEIWSPSRSRSRSSTIQRTSRWGQTPIETTTIPATSVTRKRIQ